MVNLSGRARNVLARRQRRTHIVVGENVARAHDHCGESPGRDNPGGASPGRQSPCENWSELKPSIVQAWRGCKEKIIFCKRSNLTLTIGVLSFPYAAQRERCAPDPGPFHT